ncbi:peptidoglycan/LPS O-acetylase OafA/YrhL [Primorskyibacter sedentarius]|uniref:Peptidoglycan/LPS O-acetylase OafA/YrhL n=1 Tax=Primorskyibacter sedentarius TaxID=745311 RepID=A0A4R3IJN1_9RHOB|nr:acyltransferase [Primorskyibacter sedentarius]TCS48956.1 peptidoglycan/LPS O-acetylase OafA/YrhL [Primorskyibacter sedentarius]
MPLSRFEAYKGRLRFSNLDGLRFFCIFMVLWHHAPPVSSENFAILSRGFLGVDFFFVLSGFLITTLLLREKEKFGKFSLRNFYIRRIIRIIPVYYFVVTCVSFYYVVISDRVDLAQYVPFYYFFLSNFLTTDIPTLGPTWSLSVEEQFYLVWPIILLAVPLRYIFHVGILLIALNVAGIAGLLGGAPVPVGPLLIRLPGATYAPLILGSLLAYALNTKIGFEILESIFGSRWSAFVLTIALLVFMQILPKDLRGAPNLALHLVMTAILASLVIREDVIGKYLLQLEPIKRFGVVSYGVYLYHLLALDVTNRGLFAIGISNSWIIFLSYSALAYVIAEFSFRTIEKYFQKFRPDS